METDGFLSRVERKVYTSDRADRDRDLGVNLDLVRWGAVGFLQSQILATLRTWPSTRRNE